MVELRSRQRAEVINLNLTPMIDVCAILIIFLLLGTVFGPSSVIPPSDIRVPKSVNKDVVENAAQIVIRENEVDIRFLKKSVPLAVFQNEDSDLFKSLKGEIDLYIKQIPESLKQSGILINVLADRNISYKKVFDVSRFFRASGFQGLLYVAEGE